MEDLWRWWIGLLLLVGWVLRSNVAVKTGDSYTHVKFAQTATLWSVWCFLNVESPVDISL